MRKQTWFYVLLSFAVVACSSSPKNEGPDWTRQSTRTVDNGYIVYVGTAIASNSERAQFKAEGLALEDLANECSMIPKGARIEDRYLNTNTHDTTAFVKVALEFQECEQAKQALTPDDIRKLASNGFTTQLKKYQDLSETGEMPAAGEGAAVNSSDEVQPPPTMAANGNANTHFFVMRQYVAYQKEIVILSPPTAYAPNAPATQSFTNRVIPVTQQVQEVAVGNPTIVKQAWSRVPDRPVLPRPMSLQPAKMPAAPSVQPPKPESKPIGKHGPRSKRRRGKLNHKGEGH